MVITIGHILQMEYKPLPFVDQTMQLPKIPNLKFEVGTAAVKSDGWMERAAEKTTLVTALFSFFPTMPVLEQKISSRKPLVAESSNFSPVTPG